MIEAREGKLTVLDNKVTLNVYDGLGLEDVEIAVSDIDEVRFTRSTFTNEGQLQIISDGEIKLLVTIPQDKAPNLIRSLYSTTETPVAEKR